AELPVYPLRVSSSATQRATASSEGDAGGADDRLRSALEPDERLALAVVVRRPDHDLRRLVADAAGAPVLGVEPPPEAHERVLVPLPADRRLVRVTGQDPDLMRQGHENLHHRGADLGDRATPDRIPEERVSGEAERVTREERDAVVGVARGRERLDAQASRFDPAARDLEAVAVDELVVPGDVVGVPVRDEQV